MGAGASSFSWRKKPASFSWQNPDVIFKEIDTDGSDYISFEELSQWLQRAGYPEERATLMSEIDTSEDGKISLEECATIHSALTYSVLTLSHC